MMTFEGIPRRRLYPIVGFFLAVGAPGGLLVLRALVLDRLWDLGWLEHELEARALTYGYIAAFTAIVFVGLGAILGAHEDLLQRMSLSDALTGLANRRQFDKRLREELARVDRYRQPLTLMLLDLDGLKRVNDQAGHEAGDNAIRAVARTLESTCRATDLKARIGGDEFAVLAPNVSTLEAQRLAERIRRTLSAEASWIAARVPALTLSIGVADTRSISELLPDRLYSAADRALYEAKDEGKNRVVLAPTLEEPLAEDPATPQAATS